MKFNKTTISSAHPGYEIGYSLLNAYPANAHGIIDRVGEPDGKIFGYRSWYTDNLVLKTELKT